MAETHTSPEGLPASPETARLILGSLAEFGIPPDRGIEYFSAGLEPLLDSLEERYFNVLLRRGRSCFKVVEGRYGGGKTHFLYGVRDRAMRGGFAVSLVDMRPQECSYERPLGFYRSVAAGMCMPGGSRRGIDGLLSMLVEGQRSAVGDAEAESWAAATADGLDVEVLSFRCAVRGYLKARLADETGSAEILGGYLRGEPVPMADLRPFGVYEAMTNANAFRMLRALCSTVRGLGLPGLVILVDEIDRLLTSRRMTREAEAMMDCLRDLVDLAGRHELPGTMFLVAVPGREFWDLVDHYQALAERLRSPYPWGPETPLAPVIRLDRLPMNEPELLSAVGLRLCHLWATAEGEPTCAEVVGNVQRLAGLCVRRHTERGNRRLFVRSAALLLTGAAGNPCSELSEESLSGLISWSAAGHTAEP